MSHIFIKLFLMDMGNNRHIDEWLLLTLTHTIFRKLGQIVSRFSDNLLLNKASVQWKGIKLKTCLASEIIRSSILTV